MFIYRFIHFHPSTSPLLLILVNWLINMVITFNSVQFSLIDAMIKSEKINATDRTKKKKKHTQRNRHSTRNDLKSWSDKLQF